MLDLLSSTFSQETVHYFWARFNKRPQEESLTIGEAIQCLETELCHLLSEKKHINPDENLIYASVPATPALVSTGLEAQQ